jgi:hypothetical protein
MSEKDDYYKAACAMQAGVKLKHELGGTDTDGKSLRVGLNSQMSAHGALAHLLIKKGVITEDEYNAIMLDFMKREVAMCERELSEATGHTVTLGYSEEHGRGFASIVSADGKPVVPGPAKPTSFTVAWDERSKKKNN